MAKWKASDWWRDAVTKVQEEDNVQLDAKLSKVLEKSLDAVNDRIENGDYIYNMKTGKLNRVPAKLKDVHRVTSDLIDRRHLLRKQPQIQESIQNTEQRLLKLAEAFAQFVGKPKEEKVVNEVYEGDFATLPPEYTEAIQRSAEEKTDAIHDQRQEGLQEGGRMGSDSQDSQERPGHAEQGTGNGS